MSISEVVSEALAHAIEGSTVKALRLICPAIDETAQNEGYGSRGKGYKSWVHDNVEMIVAVATHGTTSAKGFRISYAHASLTPTADNVHSIEEIVYHVIRCGLAHSTKLPDDIEWTDGEWRGAGLTGTLGLPKSLVTGLAVAVLASPSNRDGWLDFPHTAILKRKPIQLQLYWGKRDQLLLECFPAK